MSERKLIVVRGPNSDTKKKFVHNLFSSYLQQDVELWLCSISKFFEGLSDQEDWDLWKRGGGCSMGRL